jgi:hypothetical protein
MFGPARTNAIQVRKFQNNRRCSLSIENETRKISGFVHPVMVSPSSKLRITSRQVRAQKVPGESRYGETEVKKALSEEVKGRFDANSLGRGGGGAKGGGRGREEGEGGGRGAGRGGRGARACVRARAV